MLHYLPLPLFLTPLIVCLSAAVVVAVVGEILIKTFARNSEREEKGEREREMKRANQLAEI